MLNPAQAVLYSGNNSGGAVAGAGAVDSSRKSFFDELNEFWAPGNNGYTMDFSSQGSSMSGKLDPITEAINILNGHFVGSVIDNTGDYAGVDKTAEDNNNPFDETGYDQAEWEFQKQKELLEDQRIYNSAEAQKNRDWQERMSNSAYQRAVEDLEAAGLNKWLAVTGGNGASASTPSGSSATSSAGDASAPNPVLLKALISFLSSTINSAISVVGKIL